MPMTLEQIRLKQNPILTGLLLGASQSEFIAEKLFPRLPQALRGMTMATIGKERMKRHNLRRSPGATTRRVDIKYDGKVYTVDQYAVEIPIMRELLQEQAAAASLNISAALDISTIAMTTANDLLLLDYEIEAASIATDPTVYAGNVLALTATTKWSAAGGAPIKDIAAAADMIRKKVGIRPNKLILSADAFYAVSVNAEVRSSIPIAITGLQATGMPTLDQLKAAFKVPIIEVGDAIWEDASGNSVDVWGNNAILCYSPDLSTSTLSLAKPAFGFTSVLPGHPFAEQPYYDHPTKSWIYGATYERRANLGSQGAGFLFQNCK